MFGTFIFGYILGALTTLLAGAALVYYFAGNVFDDGK